MFNIFKKGTEMIEETAKVEQAEAENLLVAKDKRTGLIYKCKIYSSGEVSLIDEKGNATQLIAAEFEAKYELVN